MWYIIIFIIVGYIIFIFNSDSKKLKSEIELKGGLRKIYPILFDGFLDHEAAKIILEKTNEVVISYSSEYTIIQFRFTQLFNKLRVDYHAVNPLLGEFKNHFEFPKNTDEELMIHTIMSDALKKMNQNDNWEDASKKMDDIINKLD